jgi:excinuclease ABC subunit C
MLFDVKHLEHYPAHPGVYLMKDAEHTIIYIGKAKQLKVRLKQYFSSTPDARPMVPFLVQEIAFIDTIVVDSEKEALLLENTLIKKHQPKFNACLKDDKSYISLMVNHCHEWPMLKLVRNKGKPQEEGLYFGPYTSAYAARQIYELLTRLFPLRQCSDEELKRRTRPCLLYGIKRCCAPCVNKCTREEYAHYVQGTIKFLRGQDKEILKDLYAEMEKASAKLDYEKAASLLKMIRHIEHVALANQLVVKVNGKNSDVLALYREGQEVILAQLIFREGKLTGSEHFSFSHAAEDDEELLASFIMQHYTRQPLLPEEILLPLPIKEADSLMEILKEAFHKKVQILSPQKGEKASLVALAKKNAQALFEMEKDRAELAEKMLLDLQDTLKLNRYPKRIACFDVSHSAGKESVAALIAFTDGEKDSKRTRLFHIKAADPSDDYGALREVLGRYLTRAKEADDLPDLLIVDGGKGQLNVAISVFKELDIATVDCIAVAKQKGLHTKGMTQEKIFLRDEHDSILLHPRSHLLLLLQKMRDETHRKAITFHRARRKKKVFKSALDELAGIGPIKRARLLKHFGSVQRIAQASEKELREVKGITQKDLQTLKNLRKKQES